jgi:hypothetical protein
MPEIISVEPLLSCPTFVLSQAFSYSPNDRFEASDSAFAVHRGCLWVGFPFLNEPVQHSQNLRRVRCSGRPLLPVLQLELSSPLQLFRRLDWLHGYPNGTVLLRERLLWQRVLIQRVLLYGLGVRGVLRQWKLLL